MTDTVPTTAQNFPIYCSIMKCIKCGTDNKSHDVTINEGRCLQCNHPFVFAPDTMGGVKITDAMFSQAIADLSADNTLYFTPKQLFYVLDASLRENSFAAREFISYYLVFHLTITVFFLDYLPVNLIWQLGVVYYLFHQSKSPKLNQTNRQTSAKILRVIGVLIVITGIVTHLYQSDFWLSFVPILITGIIAIYLGTKQIWQTGLTQELLFTQSQFFDWLKQWRKINGFNLKILPTSHQNLDFPVDDATCLIVCENSAIAQLLIANNFHKEFNCVILSVTGYPQQIFDNTMQMLRHRPNLKVYAFHDCTPQGMSLVNHLSTTPNWFLNSNATIIDIGLLPRQIIATKVGMFIQISPGLVQAAKALSDEIRQTLSAEELAWLESGRFVELESFTTPRIIKLLQKGIANHQDLAGEASNLTSADDMGNEIYFMENYV
ncbi:hypothetical protein [Fortiea contorta]|uniref:hypothetical protein n=1 Tax=Fortiea contorta TaxID=1892405 RepID=UPI001EE68EF1|nr:hypothetical protein [Fortiea contorta]